jgi:hypothetical protein
MFWMNIVSVVIEKTEIYCATSRKSLIPVYSASNSNSLASLIYIHHDFFGQIQKKSTIQQFWISPLALLATSQNPERRRHIYARGPGLRIVIAYITYIRIIIRSWRSILSTLDLSSPIRKWDSPILLTGQPRPRSRRPVHGILAPRGNLFHSSLTSHHDLPLCNPIIL